MYEIITVLIILVCVLIMLIVLIQNPKGGGLTSTFGGAGTQMFGHKKATDLVEKWTWGLAIGLLVLSLSATLFISSGTGNQQPAGGGWDIETSAPAPTQPAGGGAPQGGGGAPAGGAPAGNGGQ